MGQLHRTPWDGFITSLGTASSHPLGKLHHTPWDGFITSLGKALSHPLGKQACKGLIHGKYSTCVVGGLQQERTGGRGHAGGDQGVAPESRRRACQSGVSRKLSPRACLTSSDGWALHQEHIFWGIQGAKAGVQKNASWTPDFGRKHGELGSEQPREAGSDTWALVDPNIRLWSARLGSTLAEHTCQPSPAMPEIEESLPQGQMSKQSSILQVIKSKLLHQNT
eukprot:1158280-Pelagomonas_calceolata.AAC.8